MVSWRICILVGSSRDIFVWRLRIVSWFLESGCVLLLTRVAGKKVIEAGWGQRHGFSGTSTLKVLSLGTMENIPVEYLLIYAPRTEAEVETFMSILESSVKYTTGREDVR